MKYEKIKSMLLTILVIISISLTWNIWTYQPNYETIDNGYVYDAPISESRDISSLIKPYKVIFHLNDAHYGTVKERDIDGILSEINKWGFYNFRNITNTLSERDFHRLMTERSQVEIIFPTPIPLQTYKGVLNFEDRNLPKAHFDRIAINSVGINENKTVVYFISLKDRTVFESNVSSSTLANFKNRFMNKAHTYSKYMDYKVHDHYTIYLPEKAQTLTRNKSIPNSLDPEKFKDALFNNPYYVKRAVKANGEEYTDSYSLMRVNYTNNMIFYVNPAQEIEAEKQTPSNELIEKSIKFVNEHAGWSDKYRLFDVNPGDPIVSYRLFIEGYPVFNEEGMAEILQFWGKEQIYKYVRPYFILDTFLPTEDTEMELPPGSEVIKMVENQKGFNPSMLEDITIGYKLMHDPQTPKILVLEPAWFYKYNEKWLPVVTNEEMGGNQNGMG
ncbi:YycH family regulatory protein [Oikeobacillus pervagus]|nr:two-component system activity regulator YycH [Oikeobacillus pervagus]